MGIMNLNGSGLANDYAMRRRKNATSTTDQPATPAATLNPNVDGMNAVQADFAARRAAMQRTNDQELLLRAKRTGIDPNSDVGVLWQRGQLADAYRRAGAGDPVALSEALRIESNLGDDYASRLRDANRTAAIAVPTQAVNQMEGSTDAMRARTEALRGTTRNEGTMTDARANVLNTDARNSRERTDVDVSQGRSNIGNNVILTDAQAALLRAQGGALSTRAGADDYATRLAAKAAADVQAQQAMQLGIRNKFLNTDYENYAPVSQARSRADVSEQNARASQGGESQAVSDANRLAIEQQQAQGGNLLSPENFNAQVDSMGRDSAGFGIDDQSAERVGKAYDFIKNSLGTFNRSKLTGSFLTNDPTDAMVHASTLESFAQKINALYNKNPLAAAKYAGDMVDNLKALNPYGQFKAGSSNVSPINLTTAGLVDPLASRMAPATAKINNALQLAQSVLDRYRKLAPAKPPFTARNYPAYR